MNPFLARRDGACDVFGTSGMELGWDTLVHATERFAGRDMVAFLHPEQAAELEREPAPCPVVLRTADFIASCNGGADWFGWLAPLVDGEVVVDDAVGIISRRAATLTMVDLALVVSTEQLTSDLDRMREAMMRCCEERLYRQLGLLTRRP